MLSCMADVGLNYYNWFPHIYWRFENESKLHQTNISLIYQDLCIGFGIRSHCNARVLSIFNRLENNQRGQMKVTVSL
jgi:hypothetical protein